MNLRIAFCVFMLTVSLVFSTGDVSAASGQFTLGVYQGCRFSDNAILDSKNPAADLTVIPRYRGYVAYATLQAKKLKEFSEKPSSSQLTPAELSKLKEVSFAPAAGYYYLVQANDNRYYLCKLEQFENQGKAATYWKLIFSYEEVVLDGSLGKTYSKQTYPDGSSYEGDLADGKFHGKGILKAADGTYYEGDFVNGRFNGKGNILMPDGGSYKGDFVNGKFHGKGILRQPDGRYYEGDFVNNEVHGQGAIYDTQGNIQKKGQWVHNEFVGSVPGAVSAPIEPAQKAANANSVYFFSSKFGKNGSFVRLDMSSMAVQPLGFGGNNLTVLPDGNYLIYMGKADIFHAYNLATSRDKEFEQERSYRSAPIPVTRHLFAFLKQTRMGTKLFAKSALDGTERQLSHRLPEVIPYYADAAFVPPLGNGTPFVVAYGKNIYLISDTVTKIIYTSDKDADHVRYPSVSPDGQKIAFITDLHKGIWVMNIDGTGLTQLTDIEGGYTTWSPDGKYIAFSSVSSASRGLQYQDVYDASRTARGGGAFTHRIWVIGSDGLDPHPLEGTDGNGIGLMGQLVWR